MPTKPLSQRGLLHARRLAAEIERPMPVTQREVLDFDEDSRKAMDMAREFGIDNVAKIINPPKVYAKK